MDHSVALNDSPRLTQRGLHDKLVQSRALQLSRLLERFLHALRHPGRNPASCVIRLAHTFSQMSLAAVFGEFGCESVWLFSGVSFGGGYGGLSGQVSDGMLTRWCQFVTRSLKGGVCLPSLEPSTDKALTS